MPHAAPSPADRLWLGLPPNQRRLAMAGAGAIVGWSFYNLYLAPAAERGDAMFRPTAVAVALALAAAGFMNGRLVRWGAAAVMAMAAAALARTTVGTVGGAVAAAGVGWLVARSMNSDRRATGVGLAFALLLSALWAGVTAMAMTGRWPAQVDGIDPPAIQQALQTVIVPVAGWVAFAQFRRRNRRVWGLLLLGLVLQLAVMAALSLEQTIMEAGAAGP